MSTKDDLAVIGNMGIPIAEIVKGVKADVARASHKGTDGKIHRPSHDVIAVFVKERFQPGYFENVKAWIFGAIAESV